MFAKSAVREDGQSLVFCAVLLTVLLGLTALTVDLGSLYVAQRHTQAASDAGALAPSEDLPLPSNTTAAATDATTYAHTNDPTAPATSATPVGGSGCTSPSYNSTIPRSYAACFQAKVGVAETVPLTFARVFGVNTGTVSTSAVASVNLTPSATGGNLLSNANFPTGCSTTQSDPTFCEPGIPGSVSALTAGSTIGTSGTPWTVMFGNVDWSQYVPSCGCAARYVPGTYTGPPNDPTANVIDMNGNIDGGIQQTITTVIAKKYLLSLWLSGNAGNSEPSFTGTIAIGSPLVVVPAPPPTTPIVVCPAATFCIPFTQVDNPSNQMNWEQVGVPFTATSTSTTISFVSTSSQASDAYDNTGPTIADVNVQPVQYSLVQ
jgi:Flp pilus assembly protein TadG